MISASCLINYNAVLNADALKEFSKMCDDEPEQYWRMYLWLGT